MMTNDADNSNDRPVRKHPDVISDYLDLKGRSVLDVGCGDGSLVRFFVRQGATAVGLDSSAAAIERARAAEPAGDESYHVGSGENLPFEAASFDYVVFSNSLHHLPVDAMDRALAEARRVLKPGGLLYIVEPLAEGVFFELTRVIVDETEVRREAYEAIRRAVATGFVASPEYSYVAALRFADFGEFRTRMIAVDEARTDKVTAMVADLERRFEQLGTPEPEGTVFLQPLRVNVLTKTE